jgi:hypothetical protein
MTMTTDRMALPALIGKRAEGDLVRELVAHAAERPMAAEVEGSCGAGHRERSPGRADRRRYHVAMIQTRSAEEGRSMEQGSTARAGQELLVSIELGKKTWLVACHDPSTGKISRHGVIGGDAAALIARLGRPAGTAARRVGATMPVRGVEAKARSSGA